MPEMHEGVSAYTARTNASNIFMASPSIVPGDSSQYPVNIAVDFTRLQLHALRKYMAFYKIPEVPGSSKEHLAVLVARHFNIECKKADESSSITSFVSFLTGSNDTVKAAAILRQSQPMMSQLKMNQEDHGDQKDNRKKRRVSDDDIDINHLESQFAEIDVDNLYAHNQDGAKVDEMMHSFVVKKRHLPTQENPKYRPRDHIDSHEAGGIQRKKRKGRLYCICKGNSFGNMIACDNKKCLDRSNWYHMSCVSLNPIDAPPETWYCPACQENNLVDIPENQYRKPVASVTYGDMISHALTVLPEGKGSFKDICDFVEMEYESQLNWKFESDQRKSPVWKSSVRKILFSNVRFRKHPDGKGMFCLAA